jgi:hypothetical protein
MKDKSSYSKEKHPMAAITMEMKKKMIEIVRKIHKNGTFNPKVKSIHHAFFRKS